MPFGALKNCGAVQFSSGGKLSMESIADPGATRSSTLAVGAAIAQAEAIAVSVAIRERIRAIWLVMVVSIDGKLMRLGPTRSISLACRVMSRNDVAAEEYAFLPFQTH